MADVFEPHDVMYVITGVFTVLATIISGFLIVQHLRHFTNPAVQKPIVRILFMVPIYALDSWLSLFIIKVSGVLDVFRDGYEAYALYNFFILLTEFLVATADVDDREDKEEYLIRKLEEKEPLSHPWPLCCLPKMTMNRSFYLMCKRFILQFVLVKPFLAISAFILALFGVYEDGCFYPWCGYLWITIIDNISITFALYFLVLFYLPWDRELQPYRPLPKFLCIKTVIFFAFWQGVLLAFLSFIGVIKAADDWTVNNVSLFIQDSTICIEMFFLAIAHAYAFGVDAYRNPDREGFISPEDFRNLRRVVSPKDVVRDTVSTFSDPTGKKIRYDKNRSDFANENRADAIHDSDL